MLKFLNYFQFLFELYILVQSDFIKTLGLSFCTYLWALPDCDINKILTKIIPSTLENIREKVKTLDKEYTFLRNYGIHSKNNSIRSPVKFKQSPLNYMHSCLHNAELHFQQLFCKTRDLQDLLNKVLNKLVLTLIRISLIFLFSIKDGFRI